MFVLYSVVYKLLYTPRSILCTITPYTFPINYMQLKEEKVIIIPYERLVLI